MINELMLNSEQLKAVNDTEGAVLVFAGAGSGKTRVLTHRIINLIENKHIPDYNILAITFTNKATNEMKERLNDMLGDNNVWVSTFHSLCVKILFRHAEKLGFTSSFSIFDETATRRLVLKILKEKRLEDDKGKESKYIYHISQAKNAGLAPDAYFNKIRNSNSEAMIISEVYERYEEMLMENNAMDFDGLLFNCEKLLREHSEVCDFYQTKFRYIHVDEFQDTNEIQMQIIKLLCKKWGNIFVVGDDDQSIYGWRGAEIKNILEFEKNFENAKIYKLEQNYRSTQEILDAANRLIANNATRKPKELFSNNKGGAKVEYITASSDYNEADNVISTILSLKRYNGYRNSDFAILVRNNSLTRLYEKNLNSMNISYRVFGGFKFFDRKEILDVIAYLRLLANPADSDALTRIINFPKRGIGDTTISALEAYAMKAQKPLNTVVNEISLIPEISSAVKAKIISFNLLMEDIKSALPTMQLHKFVAYMVNKVGFKETYLSTGKEEDAVRWENIEEFLRFVEETVEKNPDTGLEELLQNLTLNNEKDEDDAEAVTIATMHSAKGLEFNVVFIVACEKGIIPSIMSLRENKLEEERRVMYVAMTRARERLYISCVNGVRNKFGRQEATIPSQFVSEAKGEKAHSEPIVGHSYRFDYGNDDFESAIPKDNQMRIGGIKTNSVIEQPKKIYNQSAEGFVSGAKVRHKRYGIGTILIVEGKDTAGMTVTVVFKDLGMKKFSLMNSPLELL